MEASDADVNDPRLEPAAVIARHRDAQPRDFRQVRLAETKRS